MNIGILGGCGTWHVEELKRQCCLRGFSVSILEYHDLPVRLGNSGQIIEKSLDGIFVRHVLSGTLHQTLHCLNVLHSLSSECLVMNRPRCIELSTDKVLAGIQLQNHGVPIPKTMATDRVSIAMQYFIDLGSDVVIKPMTGSLGRGISRITDQEVAWQLFHAIIQNCGIIVLQEYIHNDGYDLRLFVVGEEVIAAMQRTSQNDWRYNIARGGIGQPYTPTQSQIELAIAASNAVGADHAGVDLMHSCDGCDVVIEVNAIPGWKTISEVTGVDVTHRIVDHLVARL